MTQFKYYVLTTPFRSTFTEHAMTFKIQDIKKLPKLEKQSSQQTNLFSL